MILRLAVLTQYRRVTDVQTDRRTERQTDRHMTTANTALALRPAVIPVVTNAAMHPSVCLSVPFARWLHGMTASNCHRWVHVASLHCTLFHLCERQSLCPVQCVFKPKTLCGGREGERVIAIPCSGRADRRSALTTTNRLGQCMPFAYHHASGNVRANMSRSNYWQSPYHNMFIAFMVAKGRITRCSSLCQFYRRGHRVYMWTDVVRTGVMASIVSYCVLLQR